jgi:hypothetical protein
MAQHQQHYVITEFLEKVKRKQLGRDNRRSPESHNSWLLANTTFPAAYLYDDSSPIASNRGNKLNRNARYVKEGRLNNSPLFKQVSCCIGGLSSSRACADVTMQEIEHAGYRRSVISFNPPYYTQDGDLVEVESEIDDDDEPLEENIYKDIRLEGTALPFHAHASLQLTAPRTTCTTYIRRRTPFTSHPIHTIH